ncbi:uncharacterized protein M6B38_326540 [Iris pallida]|uniref:Uncharacterized protein n=1 Tax=Iris pallida TaxID=29817 RepID=A0AAX6E1A9_IRIPA|nr:Uncharacterized protein M6B38_214920 [Iris pallida]KAJ6836520.1 uncharacterized protein M6B38_326540 [Iris pallida]
MRDPSTCNCQFSCFSRRPSAPGGCDDAAPSAHVASAPVPEPVAPEKAGIGKEDKAGDGGGESRIVLRSCLKKPVGSGPGGFGKGTVRWRDVEGKELAEIREFDCDLRRFRQNDDGQPNCECVIQ